MSLKDLIKQIKDLNIEIENIQKQIDECNKNLLSPIKQVILRYNTDWALIEKLYMDEDIRNDFDKEISYDKFTDIIQFWIRPQLLKNNDAFVRNMTYVAWKTPKLREAVLKVYLRQIRFGNIREILSNIIDELLKYIKDVNDIYKQLQKQEKTRYEQISKCVKKLENYTYYKNTALKYLVPSETGSAGWKKGIELPESKIIDYSEVDYNIPLNDQYIRYANLGLSMANYILEIIGTNNPMVKKIVEYYKDRR